MIYCYPRLSERDFLLFRFLGPGLGNLLFPWARALVHAEVHRHKLISPTWPQVKIGTLLRREPDTRMYSNLFKDLPDALSGSARITRLIASPRVSEKNFARASDGDVIEFSGMEGEFESIIDSHELVKEKLLLMTRSEHLGGLSFDFHNSISLHVRLGDFGLAASEDDLRQGKTNTRIPIIWYQEMLRAIRSERGPNMKAYVFSDGKDHELAPLLSMPGCSRMGFGSAIADMLALSRSHFLVASGSTFSRWASFLGRMPTVWFPGQLKGGLYKNEALECEARDAAHMSSILRDSGTTHEEQG